MRGLALPMADEMELWEVAAAIGAHRIETISEYTEREIIEKAEAYYEETKDRRMDILSGYAERRKEREKERVAERKAKVT